MRSYQASNTRMDLNFDKLFKATTKALYLNRSHPYINRDMKWCLQTFLMHGLFTSLFILTVYNIIYHDLKVNNFTQTCKNGVMCIIYITNTFQYCVLIFQKKSILKLINHMKKDYETVNKLTYKEKNTVKSYANRGSYVAKQWIVLGTIGITSFLMKSVCLMIYYYYKNEFRLVPYYDLVYPGIIEDIKNNIYVYLTIYIILMSYGLYAAVMYVAYVPLGPLMMMHACGQLEIVKTRITDLFTVLDEDVITEKFKNIIETLQCIYSFVDQIKDVFRIAYELTLKSTTLMLPIAFYEVIEGLNNGEISLEFVTFIIGGTLFSSTPCFYSQLLLDKGEEVCQALYCCGWERHYDRRTRNTLRILLLYAFRPIAIRTIFKTLCLETLTELFQQSYTIFNLMNAMWE